MSSPRSKPILRVSALSAPRRLLVDSRMPLLVGLALLSRRAIRLPDRDPVGSGFRAVLATNVILFARSCSDLPSRMAGPDRRRLCRPCHCRDRRRDAAPQPARRLCHQLPGGFAQRLWRSPPARSAALARHLPAYGHLYSDHRRHQPCRCGSRRRICADPGRRAVRGLLAVLVAISRKRPAERHPRSGAADLADRASPCWLGWKAPFQLIEPAAIAVVLIAISLLSAELAGRFDIHIFLPAILLLPLPPIVFASIRYGREGRQQHHSAHRHHHDLVHLAR